MTGPAWCTNAIDRLHPVVARTLLTAHTLCVQSSPVRVSSRSGGSSVAASSTRFRNQRGGELWCELKGDRVIIKGTAVLTLRGELSI